MFSYVLMKQCFIAGMFDVEIKRTFLIVHGGHPIGSLSRIGYSIKPKKKGF